MADRLRASTAPARLLARAEATPQTIAYRAKLLGIYVERTWLDFRNLVAQAAAGLTELGLAPGDRLAIIGEACEEWVIADLAAQACGAITLGIYPAASPSEIEYQLRDSGASLVIAEDQEYVDKVLPLLDQLPSLRWLVVIDTTAMFLYHHPKLLAWRDMIERLADRPDGAEALAARVARLRPEDPAFIVYTSGTTGQPKGALIGHGKHLAAAWSLLQHYPELLGGGHSTVVYLPLCHILGRDAAITFPLLAGIVPHYGESVEDFARTLFEVAPTMLITVPRYLQKFASQILVAIGETSPLKRAVYRAALQAGRRHARRLWEGKAPSPFPVAYRLARLAAFRPLLNKLGLDRLRLVLCGGAPLAPETMALWHIFNVNVVEIYGQTEIGGGTITGQPGRFPRPGNVGTVPRGWQVRLNEEGEILVKGVDLFDGYWRNPQATASVLDADGWLHTGDVGRWEEGRLRLVDRARDFIVTSGGKTLSPSAIESALRCIPYVSEVIVFGHNKKYVTALIEIDFDTVSSWARSRDIAYTGFANLIENPAVIGLLKEEIARANATLSRVEQVKDFRILPKLLDPEEDDEPVTPTRKVKRTQMYERYRDLVDTMYSRAEEERIAAEIGGLLEDA